jgi:hypothetical protein
MSTHATRYEQQALRNWSALRDAWEIHAELFDRIKTRFPEPLTATTPFNCPLTTMFAGRSVVVEGVAFPGPPAYPVQVSAEVVAYDVGAPGELLFSIPEWDLLDDFPVESDTPPCDACGSDGCEHCWMPCGDCKGFLNAWGECSWCATGGHPDFYDEPWARQQCEVWEAFQHRFGRQPRMNAGVARD